jgi:hypothetical protein
MNIDSMTYGELKQIAAMFGAVQPQKTSSRVEGDGRAVIVRARDAGVHYGKLVAYDGRTVWLKESRRMWSWTAKSGIALNGCATNGIDASKSKIDVPVASIAILDACEIIDCSPDASKSIEAA